MNFTDPDRAQRFAPLLLLCTYTTIRRKIGEENTRQWYRNVSHSLCIGIGATVYSHLYKCTVVSIFWRRYAVSAPLSIWKFSVETSSF